MTSKSIAFPKRTPSHMKIISISEVHKCMLQSASGECIFDPRKYESGKDIPIPPDAGEEREAFPVLMLSLKRYSEGGKRSAAQSSGGGGG